LREAISDFFSSTSQICEVFSDFFWVFLT
jgi:hypothetical protein